MENRKKYSIAILVASLVILSVAFLSLAIPKTDQVSQPAGSYTESSSIDVVAQLKPNTLFGTNFTVNHPAQIYSNITDSLNFTESYSYSSTNISTSNVELITTIVVVSTNPSWEKTIYQNTTYRAISDNWPYVTVIPVNVTSALEIASSIDAQLGYSEPDPQITIQVNTTGTSGSLEPITDGLALTVHPNEYLMSYTDAVLTKTFSETVSVDPPFYIPIPAIIAYVLIVAAAAALSYPMDFMVRQLNVGHPRNDPVKSFLRKVNRSMIIEVTKAPSENAVSIKDPYGILRLANIFESPVFLVRSMSLIYTEKEDKQYYSVIRK